MRTTRYRNVYIKIPGGATAGQEFVFPDPEDLRSAIIDAVETFSSSDFFNTEMGNAVVLDADAPNLAVVLTDSSNDRVKMLPYQTCRTVVNAGRPRETRDLVLSFPQCRIRVCAPVSVEGYAVVGVHYHYANDPV